MLYLTGFENAVLVNKDKLIDGMPMLYTQNCCTQPYFHETINNSIDNFNQDMLTAYKQMDVYSVGALFYLLLTGKCVYASPYASDTLYVPVCLSEWHIKSQTKTLNEILQKATTYDLSKRYGSIKELETDLIRLYKSLPAKMQLDTVLY